MKDFTKNLKDGLNKTTEFLKTSSTDALAKIREGAEKIGQIGPATKDKVAEVVNDVIAVLPLLEQAGYRTNEFKIGLSITPVIEISFSRLLEVPEEQLEKLKEEHEDKRMFKMILGMLNSANSLAGRLEAHEFNFHETVIEITVPPKVSLRYVHKDLDPAYINLMEESEE